jgi:predicted enzyme related to lactoylglutathione lyase
MKKSLLIILVLSASFVLGYAFRSITTTPGNTDVTTPKVTGVGGIFFKCKDPKNLKAWYHTHLGFNTDQFGTLFQWQVDTGAAGRRTLQWAPFKETTKYFAPSTKDFMINYTVDNLTALVDQLKKDHVTLVDTIETYPYGKFIHIMDDEGNKIELYEPNYGYKTEAK